VSLKARKEAVGQLEVNKLCNLSTRSQSSSRFHRKVFWNQRAEEFPQLLYRLKTVSAQIMMISSQTHIT
jgi:hypothetical protein